MRDRYPRTIAEFVAASRMVILECEDCRHKAPADLSLLELTFGADFDMYASMREMRDRLACTACGKERPIVEFYDPTRNHFRAVSFEVSVSSALEFNAYARARKAS